jgi:integrase/recombinase XerD
MKKNHGGLKTRAMPSKLSTLVSKIPAIPNYKNAKVIDEFYQYMKENGASEKHMTNKLQTVLYYATFLGPYNCMLDINKREQILTFLNTKQKDENVDPISSPGNHP